MHHVPTEFMIASAHIIGGEALGGAELFYTRLVNALQARQHSVWLSTWPVAGSRPGCDADIPQIHVPMRGDLGFAVALADRAKSAGAPARHRADLHGPGHATDRGRPGRRPIHVARLGGYYNPARLPARACLGRRSVQAFATI
jgi:hypothetical protein